MHYVVSDVHGHVDQLVTALEGTNLIGSGRAWCGGQARLTFLGDYFDRGPDGVGVIDLIRRLQDEASDAGGRVDALIGNHEILALGMTRFGDQPVPSGAWSRSSFARSWAANGGRVHDQERLTAEHIDWLSDLDSVAVAGPDLLLHADTVEYLRWGHTAEEINASIHDVMAGDDLEQWWQCWARMTDRYAFAGFDGEQVAAGFLDRLGGERVVHGHSIVATFTGQDPREITGPLSYAGGRALAIDGGIYGGGPCLVVSLEDQPGSGRPHRP